MFGIVTLGMLIAIAAVVVLHLLVSVARRGRGERAPARGLGMLGWLVYLVLIGSTAVLGGTSLYSILPEGHMRGWMLWLHLGAAGAFVVALLLVAVMWAAPCDMCASSGGPPDQRPVRFPTLTRLSFWLFVVAGTVSLASMLLAMLTVTGTEGIELAFEIHRYSGLAVIAAAVLHLYSVSLGRLAAG